ncbi:MAG: riboflavin synthase [Proteobacteria bacterium]|nr:riboflavin synthase [Pseudomonadota bacterium]
MFTGIIEGLGTIKQIRPSGQGRRIGVETDFPLDKTKIGDSIAVNGACLTAISLSGHRFEADLSPETLSISTMGKIKVGERVNIERALRFSDRLDGHIVSGHIDGSGRITSRVQASNAILITIDAPESLTRYMIKKGSVAVDGVSLTINNVGNRNFSVSIIPHTAKLTTVGFKKTGELVNIETDLIGKYVERFIIKDSHQNDAEDKTRKPSIDMQSLARTGFLNKNMG